MLTGRDLIIYILENGLENEPVVKDGTPIGFLTIDDVAKRLSFGSAAVRAQITLGTIESVTIGGRQYIPANFKIENKNRDKQGKMEKSKYDQIYFT